MHYLMWYVYQCWQQSKERGVSEVAWNSERKRERESDACT